MTDKQKNLVTMVAAVVIFIAAVVIFLLQTQGGDELPTIVPVERWLCCDHCGYYCTGTLAEKPGVCPRCNEKTMWPAMRCPSGHIVSINIIKFDRQVHDPYCSQCQSTRLSEIPLNEALPEPPPMPSTVEPTP